MRWLSVVRSRSVAQVCWRVNWRQMWQGVVGVLTLGGGVECLWCMYWHRGWVQLGFSRGMVWGLREWVFGGGGGGAVVPVRVRCVGFGCLGCLEGSRMWGGVDLRRRRLWSFSVAEIAFCMTSARSRSASWRLVHCAAEVFVGGFGFGYGEEGGGGLGAVLEPFGDGGWVGEVGEGVADGGDGFEDVVVGDFGEDSLEEEETKKSSDDAPTPKMTDPTTPPPMMPTQGTYPPPPSSATTSLPPPHPRTPISIAQYPGHPVPPIKQPQKPTAPWPASAAPATWPCVGTRTARAVTTSYHDHLNRRLGNTPPLRRTMSNRPSAKQPQTARPARPSPPPSHHLHRSPQQTHTTTKRSIACRPSHPPRPHTPYTPPLRAPPRTPLVPRTPTTPTLHKLHGQNVPRPHHTHATTPPYHQPPPNGRTPKRIQNPPTPNHIQNPHTLLAP